MMEVYSSTMASHNTFSAFASSKLEGSTSMMENINAT
jgi:hypothetical protein